MPRRTWRIEPSTGGRHSFGCVGPSAWAIIWRRFLWAAGSTGGPLSTAWQARVGQRWLVVNEDAQSIPLVRNGTPRFALDVVDGLPGYLFATAIHTGSQIVDPAGSDTLARMFLKIPVNFGRDLNDVVIGTRDGAEWVRYGGIAVPSTGQRAGASGRRQRGRDRQRKFRQWRKLSVGGTVAIAGASAWKLYDADLKLLASGLGSGNIGTAPAALYLMVYGASATRRSP